MNVRKSRPLHFEHIRSLFLKCCIVLELDVLERYVQHIQQQFNSEIATLPLFELLFVLELFSSLENKPHLDVKALEERLAGELLVSNRANHYYLMAIVGSLLELEIHLGRIATEDNFNKWKSDLHLFDLRAIYFIHKMGEYFGAKVGQIDKVRYGALIKHTLTR